jgi:hypothetical protein
LHPEAGGDERMKFDLEEEKVLSDQQNEGAKGILIGIGLFLATVGMLYYVGLPTLEGSYTIQSLPYMNN